MSNKTNMSDTSFKDGIKMTLDDAIKQKLTTDK